MQGSTLVEVRTHGAAAAVPQPGNVVIGRVTRIQRDKAALDVVCVGEHKLHSAFQGVIRNIDVQQKEADKVSDVTDCAGSAYASCTLICGCDTVYLCNVGCFQSTWSGAWSIPCQAVHQRYMQSSIHVVQCTKHLVAHTGLGVLL